MTNRSTSSNFPWSIVIILVAINLVRPLMSIAGPATMTVVMALAWVGIAVVKRIEYPFVLLAVAGADYAMPSFLMAVAIQLIHSGAGGEEAVSVPVLLTFALVSSMFINVIWVAFLGLVPQLAISLNRRS